jgi:surfeit locus 1 family protein
MNRLNFRPTWASTIATAVLFPGLVSLGFWQLDRAAEKESQFAVYQEQRQKPAVDLNEGAVSSIQWRMVAAIGEYLSPNILLDNRVRDGHVGYDVYTPFRIDAGTTILVARGWIAAPEARTFPPAIELPQGRQTLHGLAGEAPWVGIELASTSPIERLSSSLLRVQKIDFDQLHRALGQDLARFVIYLDAADSNGYDRRWPVPTSGAGKHTAYAVQWFTMAAVLVALYVKINLKRARAISL